MLDTAPIELVENRPPEQQKDYKEVLEKLAVEFTKNRSRMRRVLLKNWLHDWNEAEDVLQEAWEHVQRGVHTYDEKRPFFNWVVRIARNIVIDHVRKRRLLSVDNFSDSPKQEEGFDPATVAVSWDHPNERSDGAESRLPEILDEFRAHGSDDAVETLDLYLQGYRYEEIASMTGKAQATIRWRLGEAKSNLRRRFKNAGYRVAEEGSPEEMVS